MKEFQSRVPVGCFAKVQIEGLMRMTCPYSLAMKHRRIQLIHLR
jgi:hypothetical protein